MSLLTVTDPSSKTNDLDPIKTTSTFLHLTNLLVNLHLTVTTNCLNYTYHSSSYFKAYHDPKTEPSMTFRNFFLSE